MEDDNKSCGGPQEACCIPGCSECGTPLKSLSEKERDDWKRTASVWETIAGMRKDEADKLREELDQLTGIIANVIKKLEEE